MAKTDVQKIDLEGMSFEDLKVLKIRVDQAMDRRRETERAELKKKFSQMAEDAGFTFDELIGRQKSRKSGAVPKYRNPANPAQTWTGHGRKPRWMIDQLDAGASQDDFLIA